MSRTLALARVFSLLPSMLGLVILAAYAWTASSAYMALGVWLLLWGWTLLLMGFLYLLMYRTAARTAGVAEVTVRRNSRQIFALMLISLPVAAGCLVLGGLLSGQIRLRIDNQSGVAIESILVLGPGIREEFNTLQPGESVRRWMSAHGDGPLRLVAQGPGGPVDRVLEGYVTNGQQEIVRASFEADGSLLIDVWDPD